MFRHLSFRSGCALLLAALIVCSAFFAACGKGGESSVSNTKEPKVAESEAEPTAAPEATEAPAPTEEPTEQPVETAEPGEPGQAAETPAPEPTPAPVTDYNGYWMQFINNKSWLSVVEHPASYAGEYYIQYLIRDFDGDDIPELVMMVGVENMYEEYDYTLTAWKHRPEAGSDELIYSDDDLPAYCEQKLAYSEKCSAFVDIDESPGGWAYYYYSIGDGAVELLFSLEEEWEGEDGGIWINYENGQSYTIDYDQYEEFRNELTPAESISLAA